MNPVASHNVAGVLYFVLRFVTSSMFKCNTDIFRSCLSFREDSLGVLERSIRSVQSAAVKHT